jgi:hypothetical protein
MLLKRKKKMAIIVEAPNENYSLECQVSKKLFLAGGITNCENWQAKVIKELKDEENLTIYNPRRKKFNITKKSIQEEQIVWEYKHLKEADLICFWFSKETICPITLYELGMWGNSRDHYDRMLSKRIFIGIDPEYSRKEDVIIQTILARIDKENNYCYNDYINSIEELTQQIQGVL